MGNLKIWDALKTPPKEALKKIGGGRLKGKSDISPQWRLYIMTEQFGPCGVGWKYTIDKLWTEPGTKGVLMCFALVSLYIPAGNDWGAAIPGIGGNQLVELETAGLHNSDEGYKMAVTDALSVAMKEIGVGADVYMGLCNDSKYSKKDYSGSSNSAGKKQPDPQKIRERPIDEIWTKLKEDFDVVGSNVYQQALKECGLNDNPYTIKDGKALHMAIEKIANA